MSRVKSNTHWEILEMKHPRIWVPPTHFKNSLKILKSNSQGIGPKF